MLEHVAGNARPVIRRAAIVSRADLERCAASRGSVSRSRTSRGPSFSRRPDALRRWACCAQTSTVTHLGRQRSWSSGATPMRIDTVPANSFATRTVAVDMLPNGQRRRFDPLKAAIEAARDGKSGSFVERQGVSHSQLNYLMQRCTQQHEGGEIRGYRAIAYYFRQKSTSTTSHERRPTTVQGWPALSLSCCETTTRFTCGLRSEFGRRLELAIARPA